MDNIGVVSIGKASAADEVGDDNESKLLTCLSRKECRQMVHRERHKADHITERKMTLSAKCCYEHLRGIAGKIYNNYLIIYTFYSLYFIFCNVMFVVACLWLRFTCLLLFDYVLFLMYRHVAIVIRKIPSGQVFHLAYLCVSTVVVGTERWVFTLVS